MFGYVMYKQCDPRLMINQGKFYRFCTTQGRILLIFGKKTYSM